MTLARQWVWICDGCGQTVADAESLGDLVLKEWDVLMPGGWVHTMMDDDLCGWCQR